MQTHDADAPPPQLLFLGKIPPTCLCRVKHCEGHLGIPRHKTVRLILHRGVCVCVDNSRGKAHMCTSAGAQLVISEADKPTTLHTRLERWGPWLGSKAPSAGETLALQPGGEMQCDALIFFSLFVKKLEVNLKPCVKCKWSVSAVRIKKKEGLSAISSKWTVSGEI